MAAGGIIGAFFSVAVGGMDNSIYALLWLVIVDYITGVTASYKTGTLSSCRGFKGAIKKTAIFAVVAFANLLDEGMHIDALRDMVIFAYSANEGLSIMENLDRMGYGAVVPVFLRDKIEALRKDKITVHCDKK